jgi:MFS family permease
MLFFTRSKQEVVSRNYDIVNSGFSPLPLKPSDSSLEVRWNINLIKDLGAIFSSILLSSIGYGILMVMIALKMQLHIGNEILMSVAAMTQIGAGVLLARFLPSVNKKSGIVTGIYIGSSISAICALLIFFYINYFLWLLVVFVLGTSLFICGVSRNTIMIDLAPPQVRALIISIGTMLVALGNSLGPIVLEMTKTYENFSSFALACFFYVISMIPLSRLKKMDVDLREEKKITLINYIRNSPKIMFASFSVSYAMSSATAFSIIYGMQIGMAIDDASLLLSVLLFGTIFSIPIGYLSDIVNRRLIMLSSAACALLCAFLLLINHDINKVHVLLFLLFGCLAGIKIPAIVLINEKYKPTQRLAVNSAFSRIGLMGNISGLFFTGIFMQHIKPNGLWLSIFIILFLFLFFCCSDYLRKFIKKQFKPSNIKFFIKTKQNEQL